MTGKAKISPERAYAIFDLIAGRGERVSITKARSEAGGIGSLQTWQRYLTEWKQEHMDDYDPPKVKPTAAEQKLVDELVSAIYERSGEKFVNEAITQLEEELEMTKEALELTKAELAESRKLSEKAMSILHEYDQMKEQISGLKVQIDMLIDSRGA